MAAKYKQAERRVQAKMGFYSHLTTYVLVNGFLIVLYLITGPVPGNYNYPWFVWPMFGWGIGLLFHFAGVYLFSAPQMGHYRNQMIAAELHRMDLYNQAPDPISRVAVDLPEVDPYSNRPNNRP